MRFLLGTEATQEHLHKQPLRTTSTSTQTSLCFLSLYIVFMYHVGNGNKTCLWRKTNNSHISI
jgi:succinate dehydrogenase/fumarate reductase cytochrome b subunit